LPVQDFSLVKCHIKVFELASQEINAIQNRSSEKVEMAEDMPPVGGPATHPLQIIVRCLPRGLRGDYKIKRDRI
jgi:hypothetical protein